MNYLIFRTDRIGDFLITLPLIKSIKRNNLNAKIYVVTSNKNDQFVKSNKFVDKTILLKKNNFFEKIKLFLKLKKNKYEAIIVSDKKNRSIVLSLFLISQKKIINVSKDFQKKILSYLYKTVFLDNDNQVNFAIRDIIKANCNALNINFKDEDFNFFSINEFKDKYNYSEIIDEKKQDYLVYHYDEKWEIENYSKLFSKATNLTNIEIDIDQLKNFLLKLYEKKSMKIFLTTGFIDTKITKKLIESTENVFPSIYKINENSYLIVNQDFRSVAHLISKSKLFIACHGAFTHIAANYNIKILDIIEQNKQKHYSRITKHMNNYKNLYRENFIKLSDKIINNL